MQAAIANKVDVCKAHVTPTMELPVIFITSQQPQNNDHLSTIIMIIVTFSMFSMMRNNPSRTKLELTWLRKSTTYNKRQLNTS